MFLLVPICSVSSTVYESASDVCFCEGCYVHIGSVLLWSRMSFVDCCLLTIVVYNWVSSKVEIRSNHVAFTKLFILCFKCEVSNARQFRFQLRQ